jgi:hypothetical protein
MLHDAEKAHEQRAANSGESRRKVNAPYNFTDPDPRIPQGAGIRLPTATVRRPRRG